jgi:hypothetical protein
VVAVRGSGVATVGPVGVRVVLVDRVGRGHVGSSWECRIASSAMWETWSSTRA